MLDDTKKRMFLELMGELVNADVHFEYRGDYPYLKISSPHYDVLEVTTAQLEFYDVVGKLYMIDMYIVYDGDGNNILEEGDPKEVVKLIKSTVR